MGLHKQESQSTKGKVVMARGDHLRVNRGAYWHHGIDCGDGTVIHFSGEASEKRDAVVRRTPVVEFLLGGVAEVVRYARCDSADTVVQRAEARLGQRGYSLLRNNCEHFCRWCKTGKRGSRQVRRALAAASGLALAAGVLATRIAARKRGARRFPVQFARRSKRTTPRA